MRLPVKIDIKEHVTIEKNLHPDSFLIRIFQGGASVSGRHRYASWHFPSIAPTNSGPSVSGPIYSPRRRLPPSTMSQPFATDSSRAPWPAASHGGLPADQGSGIFVHAYAYLFEKCVYCQVGSCGHENPSPVPWTNPKITQIQAGFMRLSETRPCGAPSRDPRLKPGPIVTPCLRHPCHDSTTYRRHDSIIDPDFNRGLGGDDADIVSERRTDNRP